MSLSLGVFAIREGRESVGYMSDHPVGISRTCHLLPGSQEELATLKGYFIKFFPQLKEAVTISPISHMEKQVQRREFICPKLHSS